jgi:hypothetical protein
VRKVKPVKKMAVLVEKPAPIGYKKVKGKKEITE